MIPKDYECDGQMTFGDYILASKKIEYGDQGCAVCSWMTDKGCTWKGSQIYRDKFPHCSFMPNEVKVPRMCSNCEYSNQFQYEGESRNPIETPNIYCTHPEGSLNRRTAYKERESKGFGVGSWDRQHEWDTCDRWERHTGLYALDYEFEDE